MNLNKLQFKRNDKCPCGSNQKYKKCCEKTFEITSDYIFKKKVQGNLVDRPFDLKNTIKWRTSISKLPNEIQKSIEKYLLESPVVELGCYYNSSHLSIFDKRIKTIHGWYGKKVSNEHIIEYEELFQKRNKPMKISDYNGEYVLDFQNKVIYNPHTWNEYNGIYFDLSTEGNETFNNWIYYNKVESVDYNDIITNKIVESIYSEKLNRIKSSSNTKKLNDILLEFLPFQNEKNKKQYC